MVSNIWVAAADNQIEVVKQHLDAGASPNAKDPNGYTAIHAAASYGHIDLLRLLVQRGGDVNVQDTEGDTPLHHVEDVALAKVLIELGADYNLKNNEGQTPGQYIDDEDEFPDLALYLKSLAHDKPNELPEGLPVPGTIDGHEIKYTLENDVSVDDEERRKKIEEILNSENPEEALRDLVTSAVREGLANYNGEEESSKRKRT